MRSIPVLFAGLLLLPALKLTQDEHRQHKDVYWHSLKVLGNAVELERERAANQIQIEQLKADAAIQTNAMKAEAQAEAMRNRQPATAEA